MVFDLRPKGEMSMLQSDKSAEYNRLFEQYNKKSNEELSEIVNPENGYTEIAKKVASDILNSDRKEYYESIKLKEKELAEKQKIDKNEELLNISKDIHSIKNMMLFFVILTILGIISAFYLIYVEISNLF